MMKSAIKRMIYDYILVQTEITLSIAIIGSIFAGKDKITYHYFFLPAFLGFICMLPCVVIYLKEDLSIKQIIIQRLIELLVIEAAIIGVVYNLVGDTIGKTIYIAIAFCVLFLDVLTYVLSWLFEEKEADMLNEKIKERKGKKEHIG